MMGSMEQKGSRQVPTKEKGGDVTNVNRLDLCITSTSTSHEDSKNENTLENTKITLKASDHQGKQELQSG